MWFPPALDQLEKIQSALGAPAHRGEGYLIYRGDSSELMETLPDGFCALTITSPPYNIGKEYERPLPLAQYLDWCERWIRQVFRLTKPDGAFWLNLGYITLDSRAKAIPLPYLLWDRIPFYLIQEVIWNYGAGVAAKKSFSPRNEKFLWYVKNPSEYVFNLDAVRDPNVKYPNQKKNGKKKCNPLGKNPSDVWHFPKVTSGTNRSSKERTAHPAQFPIAVIDRIIKACSNPGDLIFDPFLGSGSLIEAALRNGRTAIGFEINSKYVQIAARRIERFLKRQNQQKLQQVLF
jgi:adenine-specific DNA-methyltransferase